MLFQVCFLDGNAWVSIFLNRRVVDAKVLRLEGTVIGSEAGGEKGIGLWLSDPPSPHASSSMWCN